MSATTTLHTVRQPAAPAHPLLSGRRWQPGGLAAILLAHAVLLSLLMQRDGVRQVLRQVTPLSVALISEAPPDPPPPAPLPAFAAPAPVLPRPAAPLPPPEIPRIEAPAAVVAPPAPLPPAPAAAAAVAVVANPVVANPTPVTPAVVGDAASTPVVKPAPPAPPRTLPASAVRYRVPPAIAVPMASRRLGESGTVLLRVWVDAQGQPRQVTLHRSSGFDRLDEQALAAMRQARFEPVSDQGQAVEWVVIAPLQYDID